MATVFWHFIFSLLLPNSAICLNNNLHVKHADFFNGAVTASSLKVCRQCQLLYQFLIKYKQIESMGGWGVIPIPKKIPVPGDSTPFIRIIKNYLIITGDLEPILIDINFDELLVSAIKKYQKRLGIRESGLITRQLIKEMNISVSERIRQISLNIERHQILANGTGGDYLLVNIPDFRLLVYENDSLIHTMKIIVGKLKTPTVQFKGQLKYIVFSPYWNIPPSIMSKEIMPAIRRNKKYMKSNHMEWYGDGIRQLPGPDNPLGKVKFIFPNRYNIYLHDTPVKSLFQKETRLFSHGCIRLEDARWLAIYLLKNDKNWDITRIDSAMNCYHESYWLLKNELPVYITYFTSWVDEWGQLQFRKDVYQKDD